MRRGSTVVLSPAQTPLFEMGDFAVAPVLAVPDSLPVTTPGRDEDLYALALGRADATGESTYEAYEQVVAGNVDPYESAEPEPPRTWRDELAQAVGPEGPSVLLSDREVCIQQTYLALRALGRASRNGAAGYESVQQKIEHRHGRDRGGEIISMTLGSVSRYTRQAEDAIADSYGRNQPTDEAGWQAVKDFRDAYAGPENSKARTSYYQHLQRLAAKGNIALSEPR